MVETLELFIWISLTFVTEISRAAQVNLSESSPMIECESKLKRSEKDSSAFFGIFSRRDIPMGLIEISHVIIYFLC